jgi:hypothetical protein
VCFGKDIFMRTEDRDPVQQADQTGPAQTNKYGRKVIKFVSHMQWQVGAQSLDLSSISRSLDARLAALANPRGTSGPGAAEAPAAPPEGAPSPADPSAIAKELKDLAAAIDEGKSKIGMGTKILTRLKTILSSHTTYGAEIAKLAFKQIDTEKQKGLLTWAFEAASANPDDVKRCAEFCNAAKVPANTIANAVNSIPDPARRVAVWKRIADSNLSWRGLDSALAKAIVLDLVQQRPGAVGQLLVKGLNPPPFEGAEAKALVLNLVQQGQQGASCLEQLLAHDMLANTTAFEGAEAKAITQNLASAGSYGARCLMELLAHGSLVNLPPFEGDEAKAITQNLAKAGDNGAYWLRWLRSNHILPNP